MKLSMNQPKQIYEDDQNIEAFPILFTIRRVFYSKTLLLSKAANSASMRSFKNTLLHTS